ncbi:MAG: hypothetical protein QOE61_911 [Micromonosporaceae bacterium]|jgi:hypothetical protein|nr:hypothetical protein [Micromonosporaceae bacterium]
MAVGEYGTATATPGFGQLVQLVRAKARAQGSFLFVGPLEVVRYVARRIAWHVLDHQWEMQDRVP